MQLSDFDYILPENLIAVRPMNPRDQARMLVSFPNTVPQDRRVCDLPEYMQPGDVMIFNDTRVIPARLMAMNNGRSIELLLHRALANGDWDAFAKPAKKISVGDELIVGDGFSARVTGKNPQTGLVQIRLMADNDDWMARLLQYGTMPVPPYFKRLGDAHDRTDYQTLFAKHDGAVAAPTAGLHFTPELMDRIRARGVLAHAITLHVGAGTFAPVRVNDIRDHVMHAEWYSVSPAVADAINAAKQSGNRIIAVGTTSARALESAATHSGAVKAQSGDTQIFITPGYEFKVIDGLVTNFHLPKSTLLMMIAAFAGYDRMRAIYDHAIAEHYRFYSYGDASLLWRS